MQIPSAPDATSRSTTDLGPTSADNEPTATATTSEILELTDLCRIESDMACDLLFHFTDHNSDAEAIAIDCGGRGAATNTFCTAGVEPDSPHGWFSADSMALGEIVGACQNGDMLACDFLFVRSPVDSQFESIGLTCGGRVPVATPNCRTARPS